MEAKNSNSSFWPFVAKTAAVLFLIALFLDWVLPDFSAIKADLAAQKAEIKADLGTQKEQIKNTLVATFKNERTKLYILSLVQNPAVLFKTSEIAEREGALDSAIRDIELAIGLLELHGADKQVIKRYNARLDMLKVAITKPSK